MPHIAQYKRGQRIYIPRFVEFTDSKFYTDDFIPYTMTGIVVTDKAENIVASFSRIQGSEYGWVDNLHLKEVGRRELVRVLNTDLRGYETVYIHLFVNEPYYEYRRITKPMRFIYRLDYQKQVGTLARKATLRAVSDTSYFIRQ